MNSDSNYTGDSSTDGSEHFDYNDVNDDNNVDNATYSNSLEG